MKSGDWRWTNDHRPENGSSHNAGYRTPRACANYNKNDTGFYSISKAEPGQQWPGSHSLLRRSSRIPLHPRFFIRQMEAHRLVDGSLRLDRLRP